MGKAIKKNSPEGLATKAVPKRNKKQVLVKSIIAKPVSNCKTQEFYNGK